MATIFLSYARSDAEVVAALHQDLVGRGHQLWIDVQNLAEASPWREEVALAIERRDVFLLAVSRGSGRRCSKSWRF